MRRQVERALSPVGLLSIKYLMDAVAMATHHVHIRNCCSGLLGHEHLKLEIRLKALFVSLKMAPRADFEGMGSLCLSQRSRAHHLQAGLLILVLCLLCIILCWLMCITGFLASSISILLFQQCKVSLDIVQGSSSAENHILEE